MENHIKKQYEPEEEIEKLEMKAKGKKEYCRENVISKKYPEALWLIERLMKIHSLLIRSFFSLPHFARVRIKSEPRL